MPMVRWLVIILAPWLISFLRRLPMLILLPLRIIRFIIFYLPSTSRNVSSLVGKLLIMLFLSFVGLLFLVSDLGHVLCCCSIFVGWLWTFFNPGGVSSWLQLWLCLGLGIGSSGCTQSGLQGLCQWCLACLLGFLLRIIAVVLRIFGFDLVILHLRPILTLLCSTFLGCIFLQLPLLRLLELFLRLLLDLESLLLLSLLLFEFNFWLWARWLSTIEWFRIILDDLFLNQSKEKLRSDFNYSFYQN